MTGQTVRKGALMKSGTPSPDPWDLSLSRQNDISACGAATAAPSHSGR